VGKGEHHQILGGKHKSPKTVFNKGGGKKRGAINPSNVKDEKNNQPFTNQKKKISTW